MSSNIKSIVLSAGLIGLLAVSTLAFAQVPLDPVPGLDPTGPTSVSGLVGVLQSVVRWIYFIFFILAVLFILFAAFTYLFARGDPTKVESAKTQIIYAAVAIIVALLAVGFQFIIVNFLSGEQAPI